MKQNTLIVTIFILSLQLMDLFRWIDSNVACMVNPYSLKVRVIHTGMWALLLTQLYLGVVGLALCKLPAFFHLAQSYLSYDRVALKYSLFVSDVIPNWWNSHLFRFAVEQFVNLPVQIIVTSTPLQSVTLELYIPYLLLSGYWSFTFGICCNHVICPDSP